MSVDGLHTVLVLGGIRSGKSEFAESLVADAPGVRYVATAPEVRDDPEWTARIRAHHERRPRSWTTEEAVADPSELARLLGTALAGETLLVDDLGGWVTVLLDPVHQPADDRATIDELAVAVRDCAARLVLVSPEVGLSLVPTNPIGRAFADALGSTNQAVAAVSDAVALVVAGQPTWLKTPAAPPTAAAAPVGPAAGGTGPAAPGAGSAATGGVPLGKAPVDAAPALPAVSPAVLTPAAPPAGPAPAPAGNALTAPTMTLPMVSTGLVIQPGMELPMPDEYAGPQALDRLAELDLPGTGLGDLEQVVRFAAATQGVAVPRPWQSVRVLLLHGDHAGGSAAGVRPDESRRRADQARAGAGALAGLAAGLGAGLQVVEAPAAAPIEDGPALPADAVDTALRYGWRLAEEAVDAGVDVLVLGSCGTGTEAAAAAVLAVTTGAEPAAVLPRVVTAGGRIDDDAWMARCAAVRDALRRIRGGSRGARDVLADVGGGDIAIATGVLLGATARRTPVILDGPVGVAAALISRDLAGQARHWCLLPDHGRHPAVRLAADVLGLTPLLDLRLDLGEGANALAALPLLRSALGLGGTLPPRPGADAGTFAPAGAARPAPADEGEPVEVSGPPLEDGSERGDTVEREFDEREFVEPEPAGPGPAAPADRPEPQPDDQGGRANGRHDAERTRGETAGEPAHGG
ncbi:bifunctional adenosylcobinamide kinase/adenosylcobinamide-phosphate guanylyltransferase [Polymorphospora rubra]|uniref:Adenosylcobinamide kinase n=1 Tax=Polymorphospora rubra TaxID=338584 RepID=A0A810MQC8_9ACTN|nr:bifunctional adenosylcobinamide kinase/adenosylcobinamide-phosphate guanylyltransferase [Polymorphospora rubra]BCJ63486.1 hypothetical protein Prubr_05070 [Polymorphospora rubra]